LAKRLDCPLWVLLLTGFRPGDDQEEKLCLDKVRLAARAEGVEVHAAARGGDRTSELLKFLGSSAPFRAVVWGGDPLVLTAHPYGGGRHWFSRVRTQIRCPIVTASLRDPDGGHNRAPTG
jgi:hypothetical protein